MNRERALKIVLVLVGLIFSAGVFPVAKSLWGQDQSMYTFDMMLSLYVALGIFLLIAARNPSANRSLIAFTAWSCFAHAAVAQGLHAYALSISIGEVSGGRNNSFPLEDLMAKADQAMYQNKRNKKKRGSVIPLTTHEFALV
jgi:predicted acyltransferase